MRNVMKPSTRYVMDTGPLPKNPVVLVMNSTIAMKIATMSNEFNTFGRIPPAIRSDVRPGPGEASVVTCAMGSPPMTLAGGHAAAGTARRQHASLAFYARVGDASTGGVVGDGPVNDGTISVP